MLNALHFFPCGLLLILTQAFGHENSAHLSLLATPQCFVELSGFCFILSEIKHLVRQLKKKNRHVSVLALLEVD